MKLRAMRLPTLPLLLAVLVACEDTDAPRATHGPAAGDERRAGGAEVADDPVRADTGAGPDHAELRSTICDTLLNTFDCARAIEEQRLPEAERANRRGDTLLLALAGGDTARYVDRPGDPGDVRLYSFQDHWRDRGYFLLQLQFYEGSAYLLVDDSTGKRTRLPDWPLPSPDGRRFAVLSLDLVAGYGPNTLQIWRFEEGEPRLERETEPTQWGPTDGEWTDPTTLRFTQHGYCDQLGGTGRDMCDRPARFTLTGGGWTLETEEVGNEP